MMKFNLIDRRSYLYEGLWQSPNSDLQEKLFYYFIQPFTMTMELRQGREIIKPTCVLGIYGEHHFVKGDVITLHNGSQLKVVNQTFTYKEGNIKVRSMLKSFVLETAVELE